MVPERNRWATTRRSCWSVAQALEHEREWRRHWYAGGGASPGACHAKATPSPSHVGAPSERAPIACSQQRSHGSNRACTEMALEGVLECCRFPDACHCLMTAIASPERKSRSPSRVAPHTTFMNGPCALPLTCSRMRRPAAQSRSLTCPYHAPPLTPVSMMVASSHRS